jgi:AroM protein
MRQAVLGGLTIGQAPRPDVTPIIDGHVPAAVRRIRGVLDGLPRSEIDRHYRPAAGAAVLVTRLLEAHGALGKDCGDDEGANYPLSADASFGLWIPAFDIGRHPDTRTSDRQQ